MIIFLENESAIFEEVEYLIQDLEEDGLSESKILFRYRCENLRESLLNYIRGYHSRNMEKFFFEQAHHIVHYCIIDICLTQRIRNKYKESKN